MCKGKCDCYKTGKKTETKEEIKCNGCDDVWWIDKEKKKNETQMQKVWNGKSGSTNF